MKTALVAVAHLGYNESVPPDKPVVFILQSIPDELTDSAVSPQTPVTLTYGVSSGSLNSGFKWYLDTQTTGAGAASSSSLYSSGIPYGDATATGPYAVYKTYDTAPVRPEERWCPLLLGTTTTEYYDMHCVCNVVNSFNIPLGFYIEKNFNNLNRVLGRIHLVLRLYANSAPHLKGPQVKLHINVADAILREFAASFRIDDATINAFRAMPDASLEDTVQGILHSILESMYAAGALRVFKGEWVDQRSAVYVDPHVYYGLLPAKDVFYYTARVAPFWLDYALGGRSPYKLCFGHNVTASKNLKRALDSIFLQYAQHPVCEDTRQALIAKISVMAHTGLFTGALRWKKHVNDRMTLHDGPKAKSMRWLNSWA